jgi:hypothetical protein
MRLLLLLVSLALAACNRPGPAPTAAEVAKAPTAPVQSSAPAAAASPESDCAFCAVPARVRECEVVSGARAMLHWKVDPSVPRIAIFVVGDDGVETLFAEQPGVGSTQTGPWLKPGLTFLLKDPAGKVLHTLVMQGESC